MPSEQDRMNQWVGQEKKTLNERVKKAKQKLAHRSLKAEDDPVTYLEGLLHEENIPPHSIAGLQFLKNKTRQIYGTRRFDPEDLASAASEIVGRNKVVPNWLNTGKLYTFRYWPDGFVDLDYFDMNPLIFIVDFESKYLWRGINMHYLDPNLRNKLYYDLNK